MLRRHCGNLLREFKYGSVTKGIQIQSKRTEVILRHFFPPEPHDESQTRFLKERNVELLKENTYSLVENTCLKAWGDMQVILAYDIEELGNIGDLVTVDKKIARNYLLPLCLAVYPSPENLKKYEKIRKAAEGIPRQSLTGHRTLKRMAAMTLPIPMNPDTPWELNKTHVKIAFRRVGVFLDRDCIELPERPVKEMGELNLHITINQIDRVPVKAVVVPYNKSYEDFPNIKVWTEMTFDLEEIIKEKFLKVQNDKKRHQTQAVS